MTRNRVHATRRRRSIYQVHARIERRRQLRQLGEVAGGVIIALLGAAGFYALILLGHGLGLGGM